MTSANPAAARAPEGGLYSAIAKTAQALGPKPAFVVDGEVRLRFDELDAWTGRLAHRLRDAGTLPGDRVMAWVEKSVEAVMLYLATLRAGLVFVPVNTAYTPAEVEYLLGDTQPAILVTDGAGAVSLGDAAARYGVPSVLTLEADGSGTLLQGLGEARQPAEARTSDDLACILYTSGTTGRSKGAMLTHGNLLTNGLALRSIWGWTSQDVLLHALPIYHVHGLFVAPHCALLSGATTLFHRRFDPEAVLAEIPRATVFMGVPTYYTRLLAEPGLDRAACANVRLFVSGSAPLLEETFAVFRDRTGQAILERYGMTETGMIASNPYEGERVPGTVGHPLPGVQVRIADIQGAILPADTPGVLEVRGPNLFQGYWRLPQVTASEFRQDGYFITGDMATQGLDGRIRIVGRAKDLIISGGLNIYPKEIELVIDALAGVDESAVIGAPHPDYGEAVVAVVALDHPHALDEQAILTALAGKLARFKQPKRIVFLDELPRNPMGKVQKARLRSRFASLFQGSREAAETPGHTAG